MRGYSEGRFAARGLDAGFEGLEREDGSLPSKQSSILLCVHTHPPAKGKKVWILRDKKIFVMVYFNQLFGNI